MRRWAEFVLRHRRWVGVFWLLVLVAGALLLHKLERLAERQVDDTGLHHGDAVIPRYLERYAEVLAARAGGQPVPVELPAILRAYRVGQAALVVLAAIGAPLDDRVVAADDVGRSYELVTAVRGLRARR